MVVVWFAFACGPVAWAADTSVKPKQLVFIRYRIEPQHFQTVVDNFKRTMRLRGYEAGKHIEYIDVLTKTANIHSVPEVIAAVEKYKGTADMFVTCGWVSLYARELLKETKVPQLFVPVLESVALKMLPSLKEEPATNLSGLYLMYPPEKILRIAKFILPDIQNYAYVFDSAIPADVEFKAAYERLSRERLFDVKLHYFDLAAGVDKVLQQLRENRIDAYGGIVGAFKHRKQLNKSGIPTITSFTLDIDEASIKAYVKDDLTLAGLFNPFGYCGEQAAHMAADIFEGRKTIYQTRPQPARQVAFVNLLAAEKMRKYISFEVIEAVDMVVR